MNGKINKVITKGAVLGFKLKEVQLISLISPPPWLKKAA